MIKRVLALAAVPAVAIVAAVLPSAAQAATPGCALVSGCTSIQDFHATTDALQAVTGVADSRLTAVPPAVTERQDFVVQERSAPVGSYVIKYAPNGVVKNLCLEQVGGKRSHVLLNTCDGNFTQRWYISEADAPGENIVNALSGLALTHVVNHGVQVRTFGDGTAAGKRWTFPGL